MCIGQKRMFNIIVLHFKYIDALFLRFLSFLLIKVIVLLIHYVLQYHFDRCLHLLIFFFPIQIHDVFTTRLMTRFLGQEVAVGNEAALRS